MKHSILFAASAALLAFASASPFIGPRDVLPSLSSRKATAPDTQGEWKLLEDTTPEQMCPMNIIHTSWTRVDGVVKLAHNTIIVDGNRCDSLDLAAGGKALSLFSSTDFDGELNPIGDAVPLPTGLVEMLSTAGPNIATLAAHLNFGEEFLVGYENKNRVCGDMTVLPDRTTVFISRPFKGPLLIKNFGTKLTVGSRWMIVVPRFLAGACLYEQQIRGTDESMSSGEILGGSPEGEMPPTEEPEPSDEDESESACFPGRAIVELEDGSVIAMRDLTVGDRVHVGQGVFSPVFAFSHADNKVNTRFVTIATEAGRELTVTPGHYVYANERAIAAGQVKVGDHMVLAEGGETVVTAVTKVADTGLYNPQTLQGDIAVDGILVSTYTTAVEAKVAEAILAPVRAFFRVTGVDALFGSFQRGAPSLAKFMPKGAVVA